MLQLSDKITRDISSNQTSITPLIVVNDSIYISTVKGIFDTGASFGQNRYWEDRDLKLSSIKESVDLIDRKFKINNLSFGLNNYPLNGLRFSDFVSEESLINKYVDVYYKTPSCQTLQDCILVYRGTIRRFTHDSKSAKIQLEDVTEDKLSKKIPIASTGFSNNIYRNNDIDKSIPMCYGYLDKAPAIAFIDNATELSGSNNIYITPDDTLNTDRTLNIGGFKAGTFNYLLSQDSDSDTSYSNIHPLFIYKDDYYRVLQNVDTTKIEDLDDGWDWSDYEQYKVFNNFISIEKKFNSSFPLNPPANNEFQCIKIRFPKEIKVIPNPSEFTEGEDSGEVDEDLLNVRFEQTGIKNPLFAIDDPFKDLQSKFLIDSTSSFSETHASIPNFSSTLQDMEEDLIYVNDFRPHANVSSARGVSNIHPEWQGEGGLQNYQWELKSWLWRYAHTFNTDHHNPVITFIKMPNIHNVKQTIAIRLEREFLTKIYTHYFPSKTPVEIEEGVNETVSTTGHHPTSSVNQDFWFHRDYDRHNMCYNMSRQMTSNWAEQNGLDPQAVWGWSTDTSNFGYTPHPPSHYQGRMDLTWFNGYGGYQTNSNWGDATHGYNYNDKRSYAYLCEQDAQEYGKPSGGSIKHGTELMAFMGFNSYLNWYFPDSWAGQSGYNQTGQQGGYNGYITRYNPLFNSSAWLGYDYGGWDSGFGYSYAVVGTEADSLNYNDLYTGHWVGTDNSSPGNNSWYNFGKARYYNFFNNSASNLNNNSSIESLYNADDYPQYSPVHCSYKSHQHNYCLGIKYQAIWNGVDVYDVQLEANADREANGGLYHDGGDQTTRSSWNSSENQMDCTEAQRNGGWHMWIKEDIIGVGGSELTPTIIRESNINYNPKLIIPKNTILACQHKGATHSGSGFTWQGEDFGLGEMTSAHPEHATIYAGTAGIDGTAEQRVGVVMPFADLGISDNIKCDTFFFGKVSIELDNENSVLGSGISNTYCYLSAGAADFTLAQNDDGNLDWGVWDDSQVSLVYASMDSTDTVNALQPFMFSTFPEDTDPNVVSDFNINVADQSIGADSLNKRISQFHDPSNYNSLVLQYKILADYPDPSITAVFKSDIYSAGIIHYLQFEGGLDSDLYVDTFGRVNNEDDYIISENQEQLFKYTGELIIVDEETGAISSGLSLIERPCDVIYHLLEKELGLFDIMDLDSIISARGTNDSIQNKVAFSLTDSIKAKDFIKDLCSNSNILPLFKGTAKFAFANLDKNTSDTNNTIISSEIIKYSFTRTPIEKVHTLVNVKYKKNYAEDELARETGWVDGYDFFGNGDSYSRNSRGYSGFSYDYLGLERDEKIFEFEAEFIRDKGAAKALRDFIFLWSCNQHNIFKLTLPIKYMYLEVGDIINFDSLIDGLKAYGEDYTQVNTRNEQIILPSFIITSTDKKQKGVAISVTQMHKLEGDFDCHKGSISRSIGIKAGFDEEDDGSLLLVEDLSEMLNFINGNAQYYTEKQVLASDIIGDGYVNMDDYNALLDTLGVDNFLLGDVNLDGFVNVLDIVTLVNQILGSEVYDDDFLAAGDFNEDGILNVIDIVQLVNTILGDG